MSRRWIKLIGRKHLQDLLIQNHGGTVVLVARVRLHAGENHDHTPEQSNGEHGHGDQKFDHRHSAFAESRLIAAACRSLIWRSMVARFKHCCSSIPLYPVTVRVGGPKLDMAAGVDDDGSPG